MTTTIQHKIDVDQTEDGCIAYLSANIDLFQGGCTLTVTFSEVAGGFGGWTELEFHADSFCPEFLDAQEGVYSLSGERYLPVWFEGADAVLERRAETTCLSGVTLGFPGGDVHLERADGGEMIADLSEIELAGDLFSEGDPTLSCVDFTACAPEWHDNGTGSCVREGCTPGYHDGGDGVCVERGSCSPGYVDNGDGVCVPEN